MVQDAVLSAEAKEDVKFIPITGEDEEDCKVYISNIPNGIGMSGFRRLFKKHGVIEEIYFPTGNKWAFVTYTNKAECEVAIMTMQGVLGMKTDFAKKKEKNEVDELLDRVPIMSEEPEEPEEVNIKEMIEPFKLPTFKYEFPKPLITEEDYKFPEMLKFDPKKEFLFSHDMFWAEKYTKNFAKKMKKTKKESAQERKAYSATIPEKIFPESPSKEIKSHKLVNCASCQTRKSITACLECKKAYCSSMCQKKDHRNSCNSSKKIDQNLNEEKKENRILMEELNEVVPFPDRKCSVSITAIHNPREIFVRSLTSTANAKYMKILNLVHGSATTAPFLKKPPKLYTMVLAKHENIYTRAFVVHQDELLDLTTVIFYDFGHIKRLPWMELKELDEKLALLPKQIFRCNLKDIGPLEYTTETLIFCSAGLAKIICKIHYDDLPEVEMPEVVLQINEWTEKSINKFFKNMLAQPEQIPNVEMVTQKDLDETETWPKKDVEIIILDNTKLEIGMISCAIYAQYIQFLHQWELMQERCENLGERFVPVPGHFCLVKVTEDGKWHRALCSDTNKFRILKLVLVDCGVVGSILSENSRKLPPVFDFPIPLKVCKIQGFSDKISKDKLLELQQLLPQNKRIVAKELKEVPNDFIYLSLYDI